MREFNAAFIWGFGIAVGGTAGLGLVVFIGKIVHTLAGLP